MALTNEAYGNELGFNIVNQLVSALWHTNASNDSTVSSFNFRHSEKAEYQAIAVCLFALEP